MKPILLSVLLAPLLFTGCATGGYYAEGPGYYPGYYDSGYYGPGYGSSVAVVSYSSGDYYRGGYDHGYSHNNGRNHHTSSYVAHNNSHTTHLSNTRVADSQMHTRPSGAASHGAAVRTSGASVSTQHRGF